VENNACGSALAERRLNADVGQYDPDKRAESLLDDCDVVHGAECNPITVRNASEFF